MAEVLSYATPTTDGRELLRYQAWQRRMILMRKVRWWWLGVVGAGFLLAGALALGGSEYDAARRWIIAGQMFVGGPTYVMVVTVGTCGRIWPIPLAVVCGIVVFFLMTGLFLPSMNAESTFVALLFGVVFSALWYLFARVAGRLDLPKMPVESWDEL